MPSSLPPVNTQSIISAAVAQAFAQMPINAAGIKAADAYLALGDSYTDGSKGGSSSLASAWAQYGYAWLLANQLGFSSNFYNRAANGHGWQAAAIRAVETQSFTNGVPQTKYFTTYMNGYNDIRFMGDNTGTLSTLKNCLTFNLVLQFAAKVTAAGSMTAGGTTAGFYDPAAAITRWSLAKKIGGTGYGIDNTTLSALDTTTLTTTSSATNIAVIAFGDGVITASTGAGPVTTGTYAGLRNTRVTIDGALQTEIVCGNENCGAGYAITGTLQAQSASSTSAYQESSTTPAVGLYTGLANKSKTIVLSNGLPATGVTAANNKSWFVDSLVELDAPQNCAPMVIGLIQKTKIWNNGVANYQYGSDALVDKANAVIKQVVVQFQALGYPVVWVDPMAYWDNVTNLDSDAIHPNAAGHQQILQAFQSGIRGSMTPSLTAAQKSNLNAAGVLSAAITSWFANKSNASSVFISGTQAQPGLTYAQSTGLTSALNVGTASGLKVLTGAASAGGTGVSQSMAIFAATPTDAKYGYVDFYHVGNPSLSVCFAVKAASPSFGGLGYGYLAINLSSGITGDTSTWTNAGVVKAAAPGTPYVAIYGLQNSTVNWIPYTAGTVYSTPFTTTPAWTTAANVPEVTLNTTTAWPQSTAVRWQVGISAANNGTAFVQWYNTSTSAWVTVFSQQNMNALLTGNYASGQVGVMLGVNVNNGLAAYQTYAARTQIASMTYVSTD
jgi:hypothetical protein